jgi:hypothetical protein
MTTALSVSSRVTVGWVIAAADLAAFQTDPQVEPRVSHYQALLAALDGLGGAG